MFPPESTIATPSTALGIDEESSGRATDARPVGARHGWYPQYEPSAQSSVNQTHLGLVVVATDCRGEMVELIDLL